MAEYLTLNRCHLIGGSKPGANNCQHNNESQKFRIHLVYMVVCFWLRCALVISSDFQWGRSKLSLFQCGFLFSLQWLWSDPQRSIFHRKVTRSHLDIIRKHRIRIFSFHQANFTQVSKLQFSFCSCSTYRMFFSQISLTYYWC